MAGITRTNQVPVQEIVIDPRGFISRAWQDFLIFLQASLDPLGVEKTAPLENGVSTPATVSGLSFNSKKVSQASVDFLIQRITAGAGSTELVESGMLILVFKPVANTWVLSSGPTTAGIALTVTADGQVKYTSSTITGTANTSKIVWRARTLAAKNQLYSTAGMGTIA